jgi:hypothetical protein
MASTATRSASYEALLYRNGLPSRASLMAGDRPSIKDQLLTSCAIGLREIVSALACSRESNFITLLDSNPHQL